MSDESLTIEIYVEDNTQDKNLLCKTRGFRRDVFVKINNMFYKMSIFSYQYLKQYLQNQYTLDKTYCIESNLSIVRSLTTKNIIASILKQAQNHYFDGIKECIIKDGKILYPLDNLSYDGFVEQNWATSVSIDKLSRLY